ncbi:ecotropic viral integration site 5 protein [Lophium mytilinum]|uniref:Ecotropic viral integration site 5 protein n=1 Tax=Lophium mytilinum TaxID=390894 RepID=A0A6A6Q7I5_9PEZI|nr:ecotropic viral integration site 5 protein [Lophium mytilinum]
MDLEATDSVHMAAEAVKRSPRTHVDSQPLPTDSMVTVSLSESDAGQMTETEEEDTRQSRQPEIKIDTRRLSSRPSSLDILRGSTSRDSSQDATITPDSPTSPRDSQRLSPPTTPKRSRSDSNETDHSVQVDWEELEKTEEQEPREKGSDDSMALLLARLEQENNAIATDPKSGLKARSRSQSRPPSIHQLKKLVAEQDGAAVRFSLLPSPPPMTELEFWAALVRDYPQTIQRLPTLTLNKIRGGIPPPLRGVVWQSMAGSRDRLIEEQYESLCGQPSSYENIINKDIGRSFPGVDMFRDPEGEGQKMMGRVLKCFSLYDTKIGYCQGLGFLVGPLLMQMGDKEAFCVLVRLMEDYDLRSCFLPDLSGLHLRIYQFQQLLKQHMPELSAHLDTLQVEAAYLSQWFLSFFAVTCPLPMLFRIYDVIFAEGASETIMRVALSIMKRNEEKILASSEFEDVMQLLLSRALWDPYGRNARSADELVNDFVGFTGVVTRDSLQNLEAGFKTQKDEGGVKPGVQKTATSFLGRLWAPSSSSTKSVSLSPNLSAPSRPVSFLRRTPSKQSLASTLNSIEGGSDASHASTAPTEVSSTSRVSSADALSIKSTAESFAPSVRMTVSNKDKDLHGQIEELLVHISQMQKDHTSLTDELQREREERREDQRAVRAVVDRIRTIHPSTSRHHHSHKRGASLSQLLSVGMGASSQSPIPAEVVNLVESLDTRFPADKSHRRKSSAFETKEFLRESLSRTKEQLNGEATRTHTLQRQLDERDKDLASAQEVIRETRHRLQESYSERQRLDKVVNDLRASARKGSIPWSPADTSPDSSTPPSLTRSDTADTTASNVSVSGLREFKLNRTGSVKQQQTFAKRSSSLATQSVLATENHAPADNEALLLELVTAKTSEAVARQELEELKGKMDAMRRALSGGVASPGGSGVSPGHKATPSEVSNGFFGAKLATPSPGSVGTQSAQAGGFWGWGKRSVSTPLGSEGGA